MIKVFRKIRQRLLTENKFSKYLLYAIGEIALVVIGILIALQINNWNETKKEQLKEAILIDELLTSIASDIGLNTYVQEKNKESRQSIEILLNHLKNNYPYKDSLSFHFANAHNRWIGLLNINAFENAKSHGLDFISRDSTKIMLSSLYQGSYEMLKNYDDRNNQYYYNIVVPELTELFEITYPQGDVFIEMVPINYQDLLSNKKYINILKSLYAYNYQYIKRHNEMILVPLVELKKLLEVERN